MFDRTRFLAWPRTTLLVLALAPLSVGCGSKGTVSGKVFYEGKPLPGGMVTFLPADATGAFHSVINEDGSYKVAGIPPGPATITVSSPDPPQPARQLAKQPTMEKLKSPKGEMSPEIAKHMGDPEAGKRKYMTIPSNYKDPNKSGLTYAVKSGSQDFDIQLK
jgi:hypothetical protein